MESFVERLLCDDRLHHPQHGSSLLVGDVGEIGGGGVIHGLVDGVGIAARVLQDIPFNSFCVASLIYKKLSSGILLSVHYKLQFIHYISLASRPPLGKLYDIIMDRLDVIL